MMFSFPMRMLKGAAVKHVILLISLCSIGHNLTVLDFRELWMFKYSNLRSVKANCPNLVSFALVMTTKNIVTSINQIHVDKVTITWHYLVRSTPAMEYLFWACIHTTVLSGPQSTTEWL